KSDILTHPKIVQFLNYHSDITDEEIDKRLNRLYEYMTQSIQCDRCQSYSTCINMVKGYSPILQVVDGEIHLSYEKCENHLLHEQQSEKQNLIQSLYMPKEILNARVENIAIDTERKYAIKEVSKFLDHAEASLPEKG